MANPNIPNLCGANPNLNDSLSKIEELKDKLLSNIDVDASTLKSELEEGLDELTSAFDKLDIELNTKVDFILIGAGLGKLLHFEYLSKFNVPCIDIGYIFQTWLDPTCSSHRAFCSPNDIYDIKFDK